MNTLDKINQLIFFFFSFLLQNLSDLLKPFGLQMARAANALEEIGFIL